MSKDQLIPFNNATCGCEGSGGDSLSDTSFAGSTIVLCDVRRADGGPEYAIGEGVAATDGSFTVGIRHMELNSNPVEIVIANSVITLGRQIFHARKGADARSEGAEGSFQALRSRGEDAFAGAGSDVSVLEPAGAAERSHESLAGQPADLPWHDPREESPEDAPPAFDAVGKAEDAGTAFDATVAEHLPTDGCEVTLGGASHFVGKRSVPEDTGADHAGTDYAGTDTANAEEVSQDDTALSVAKQVDPGTAFSATGDNLADASGNTAASVGQEVPDDGQREELRVALAKRSVPESPDDAPTPAGDGLAVGDREIGHYRGNEGASGTTYGMRAVGTVGQPKVERAGVDLESAPEFYSVGMRIPTLCERMALEDAPSMPVI